MFNLENMLNAKPATIDFDTPYCFNVEAAEVTYSKEKDGSVKVVDDKNGRKVVNIFAIFKTTEKGIIMIRLNSYDTIAEGFTQEDGFTMNLASLYFNAGLPYPGADKSMVDWNREVQEIISKNPKVWFLKKKPADSSASGFWSLCRKPKEKLPELPPLPPKTKKATTKAKQ